MEKFKNTTNIEVRYQETDQMGVVYHANYLVWFEIGRTKFIEELGLKYTDMEDVGILSPVTELNISYKKPARYGEPVRVVTWLSHYDGIRTIYQYEIFSDNDLVVSGASEHVIVKKDGFKPVSLRKYFPNWHEIYSKLVED